MKNVVVGIIVAIVVVAGIWYLLANGGFSTSDMIEIELASQNNSDQSGEATIEAVEEGVVLALNLNNAPEGVNQPAYIYTETCAGAGESIYPLTGLVDGKSETIIAATLEDIKSSPQALSIRIFKSDTENVVVACGNFPVVQTDDSVDTDAAASAGASVDTSTSTSDEAPASVEEEVVE